MLGPALGAFDEEGRDWLNAPYSNGGKAKHFRCCFCNNGHLTTYRIDSGEWLFKCSTCGAKGDFVQAIALKEKTEYRQVTPELIKRYTDRTITPVAAAVAKAYAVPAGSWPAIEDMAAVLAAPPACPAELIKDVAFEKSKITLAGPSKSMKTFFQLYLAICVATGKPWFGHATQQGKVLYVNFELCPWSFQKRVGDICAKLNVTLPPDTLHIWNLRGNQVSIEQLQLEFTKQVNAGQYALIVFDPLYKILGARNENEAAAMADLYHRLESIAHKIGAAYCVAHHFAKGQAAAKNVLDRASGSGVVARDGDCILTLTPHETEDCFTLDYVLRDFPHIKPQVLRWVWPLFEVAADLDPERLKTKVARLKPITTADVVACLTTTPLDRRTAIATICKRTGRGVCAVKDAIKLAETEGQVFVHEVKSNKGPPTYGYSRQSV